MTTRHWLGPIETYSELRETGFVRRDTKQSNSDTKDHTKKKRKKTMCDTS